MYINLIVLTLTGDCIEWILLFPVTIRLGQQLQCSQILHTHIHAEVTILALLTLEPNDPRLAHALPRGGIAIVQHSGAQFIAIAGQAL